MPDLNQVIPARGVWLRQDLADTIGVRNLRNPEQRREQRECQASRPPGHSCPDRRFSGGKRFAQPA